MRYALAAVAAAAGAIAYDVAGRGPVAAGVASFVRSVIRNLG